MRRCLNDAQRFVAALYAVRPSKLYLRCLVGHLTVVTELEEFMRHEAKSMCEQHGRELLDHTIVPCTILLNEWRAAASLFSMPVKSV